MIYYQLGWANIFKVRGSVFPKASKAAIPCGILAALIRFGINEGFAAILEADDSILSQTQAWAGFSVLVGFLIIFRSSQAYSRFWDGCTATHHMRADWFDAASALIAFTEDSKAPEKDIATFKHTVIRLVSMMHSAAFMDLEEMNNKWGTTSDVQADIYALLDPLGIDEETLDVLYESKDRVMLIFQWLQLLIVRSMNKGIVNVPPPILSRAYNELANGMVAFHECVKISDTPFPFPYAQNCDLLLLLHWILVPFVVSQWVSQPLWAFVFVFMQVFVLWSLNYIAIEIENPFGTDDNAIDGHHMQDEMNRHLLMLVDPKATRTPGLSPQAVFSVTPTTKLPWEAHNKSFKDIWLHKKKKSKKKSSSSTVGSPTGSEAPSRTGSERDWPRDDRLREEAQARAGAPSPACEPGGPWPAQQGLQGSWAILLEEGRDSGSCRKDKVYDGAPQPHWDHGSPAFDKGRREASPPAFDRSRWEASPPALDKGRWEAIPCRERPAPHAHSAPPQARDDASSSGSDSEGGRYRGRSGSRRRHGRRKHQRV